MGLALSIIAGLGVALRFWPQNPTKKITGNITGNTTETIHSPPQDATETPSKAPPVSADASNDTPKTVNKITELLSTVSEELVAKERKQGAEEASQRLHNFALDLAPLVFEGLKNEAAAENLFGPLIDCAREASTAVEARAVCAANAKRIELRYPARFSERFAEVQKNLSPEILRFIDQVH